MKILREDLRLAGPLCLGKGGKLFVGHSEYVG
jgi:hypothetical protein